MRVIILVLLTATPAIAGCYGAQVPGWDEWTDGDFVFHVPTRDRSVFADLQAVARSADANLSALLGGPMTERIDVYAYTPHPPTIGAPSLDASFYFPAHANIRTGHFQIYLAQDPPGFHGLPPEAATSPYIFGHELTHIYQSRFNAVGLRGEPQPLPRWLLEGGATLAGAPTEAAWGPVYLEAIHVMFAASAAHATLTDVFDAASRVDDSLAIHQGGALLLSFLSTACGLPDPPWPPLAQAFRDGVPIGIALRTRCGADEASLIARWHAWLADEALRSEQAQPALLDGRVIAEIHAPRRFRDACGTSSGSWWIEADARRAELHHDEPPLNLSGDDLFPLSVACPSGGSAIALAYGADDVPEAVLFSADGAQLGRAEVPHPVSSLSWDAVDGTGLFWSEEKGKLTLTSIDGELHTRPLDSARVSSAPVFAGDGHMLAFTTREAGTLEGWTAAAAPFFSNATRLPSLARPAFTDASGGLWISKAVPGGTVQLAPWNQSAFVPALRYAGGGAWAGPRWALIDDFDPLTGDHRLVDMARP